MFLSYENLPLLPFVYIQTVTKSDQKQNPEEGESKKADWLYTPI